MQLKAIENQTYIVSEQFVGIDNGAFGHLQKFADAISNTAANWDVVLFLLLSVVIIFGSIILFVCSIKKIFKFQSEMELKARLQIREKKITKHRNFAENHKLEELEAHKMDDEIVNQIKSEEHFDIPVDALTKQQIETSPNLDDTVFVEHSLEPYKEATGVKMSDFEIDYSTIDMWNDSETAKR